MWQTANLLVINKIILREKHKYKHSLVPISFVKEPFRLYKVTQLSTQPETINADSYWCYIKHFHQRLLQQSWGKTGWNGEHWWNEQTPTYSFQLPVKSSQRSTKQRPACPLSPFLLFLSVCLTSTKTKIKDDDVEEQRMFLKTPPSFFQRLKTASSAQR